MGKLADAIEATAGRRGGVECSLGRVMREMDDEDRADLTKYLKRLDVSATRIWQVLNSLGYDVNVYTVRKHRNRLLGTDNGVACRCQVDG